MISDKINLLHTDKDVNSNPDNIVDINLGTQNKSQYRINNYY